MTLLNLPTWYYFVAVASILTVAGLAVGYWYYRQYRDNLEDHVDKIIDQSDDEIEFEPPDIRRSFMDYFRVMRHYQRQSRLAKKGYVKWFRLGSTLSRPVWVKPELEGSGQPKVTIDDQPYYFPKEAMVSDTLTGAWVALHREGEADPVNLRDPAYPGIETDLLERTINMEAENKPPGFFDKLALGGMDKQTLLWGGMGVLFAIYAGYMYMTGAI